MILFPCNGNAHEALDCLSDDAKAIGFVDDDLTKHNKTVFDLPVHQRNFIAEHPNTKVLAVPGSPTSYQKRKEIIISLNLSPERWAKVIHPRANVSKHAIIGFNVLIMAGVVIGPHATIGNHVVILPNTVIHHDAVIEDFNLIGSNVTVAGSVRISENCYIGSGSSIMNGISIGAGALVGMGSNVIKNINPRAKVVGNPARAI